MAHKFLVLIEPQLKKDGTESENRKNYTIVDRGRKGRRVVGVTSSKKEAEAMLIRARAEVQADHILAHPNDLMHLRKRKLVG